MNRWRSGAVALVSAALIVVGVPAPAQADDVPSVLGAYSDYDGNRGTLLVSVSASHPVAHVRAEIIREDWAQVAVTDEFVLRSGTEQQGVWATAHPLILGDLGTYSVNVEVTDDAGNRVRQESAGWLTYLVVTSLADISVDRTTVDYDHRAITMRGRLTGRWPGTNDVRPVAGATVGVHNGYGPTEVTTEADGSFVGTATMYGSYPSIQAQYLGAYQAYEYADSPAIPVTIAKRPTRLTASIDKTDAVADDPVTISGTLEWETATGWRPFPNVANALYVQLMSDDGDMLFGPLNIDADGRYEATTVARFTGYYLVDYSSSDAFVADSFTRSPVLTVHPANKSH